MLTSTASSQSELVENNTERPDRDSSVLTDEELEYLVVSEGDLATTAYRPPGGSCR